MHEDCQELTRELFRDNSGTQIKHPCLYKEVLFYSVRLAQEHSWEDEDGQGQRNP